MWYVLQVRTGTEENIRTQCRNNIPEAVLTRCFIRIMKRRGVSAEHGR